MIGDMDTNDRGWFGMERKWWVLAVVGIGTFMSALDGSVVNTALPIIGRETHSPLPTLEWVILVYLLTIISTLLMFGRLSDIYGRKRFYLAGMSVFVIGSALCGLAPGVGVLILFRGIQALGSAMALALGPAILTQTFPSCERGRALGMQATLTYLGLATGPALGGLLTHHLGWRSVFYINVPIGMIVLPIAIKALKQERSESSQSFDVIGTILMAVGLSSLMFAFTKGPHIGWNSPPVFLTLALGIVTLTSFIVVERTTRNPLLDLTLFRNWTFAASTFAAFLNYVCSAAVSFIMPFYLIYACGYRVDFAGLLLIATPAVMSVTAMPSGWLSDRFGPRLPATIGMAITVSALLLLRTLQAGTHPLVVSLHLAMIGLGIGLFTSPNNSAIMGSAPISSRGIAGAILATARNLGFVIGVACAGMIYTSRLNVLRTTLSEPAAITQSMHDATSVIAMVASIGILASALRGDMSKTAHQPECTH